ncbi:MAG: adenylate/guanylate cyclase domain-containing protein, partial [Frankiaceae bacterium]|nr:adenylate/guanylate cyclase domain-containing protein [Frankiaceae bacterium]
MQAPRTRYVETEQGAHVAYQVVGDGPVDLMFIPWWWSNLEWQWEDPLVASFLDHLSRFARLITFDVRGVGVSDPAPLDDLTTLEGWMRDAVDVLDAAGSRAAVIIGHGDGGLIASVLAATHPERCSGLILIDSYARLEEDEDYEGWERGFLDDLLGRFADFWGSGNANWVTLVAPSEQKNKEFRFQLGRLERLSVSPGAARAMQLVLGRVDVRPALATISVPTLVLHHVGNTYVPVHFGRQVAAHIPDAELIELEGADHLYWIGNTEATLRLIEQHVAGSRGAPRAERVLATVLLTDIVASTDRVVALGDERWRDVLRRHDDMVDRQLERFRGDRVKSTGDGVLARFDGPARAIDCGCAIRDAARQLGLSIRAGLHTGEIELIDRDIAGVGVHIASRIASLAQPNEV